MGAFSPVDLEGPVLFDFVSTSPPSPPSASPPPYRERVSTLPASSTSWEPLPLPLPLPSKESVEQPPPPHPQPQQPQQPLWASCSLLDARFGEVVAELQIVRDGMVWLHQQLYLIMALLASIGAILLLK